jgi:hypothetical protein
MSLGPAVYAPAVALPVEVHAPGFVHALPPAGPEVLIIEEYAVFRGEVKARLPYALVVLVPAEK